MDDETFDKVYEAIEQRGKHKRMLVSYAMDRNLDDIAIEGKVKVIFDEFYASDILTNPTYLDLAVVANDMIHVCEFHDHIFLEDMHFEKQDNDVKVYTLHFGS